MWELVSCDIHRYISLIQAKKPKIILGDLETVFGGVESSLDSSSAFLKLSSSLSKLSLRTESHFLKSQLLIQLFIRAFRFLSSNFLPCTRCSCITGGSLRSKFVVKTKRDQLLHQMVQSVLLLINDVLVVCQCRVQIFPSRYNHVSVRQTCTF